MRLQFFAWLSLFCLSSLAQTNLVYNPSFERVSSCPDYPGQINRSIGWFNPSFGGPIASTPDLFHACGTASLGYNTLPPNTFCGPCYAHTGGAFAGLSLYNVPYPNAREYMYTQLANPMVPGKTYTVSFWLTNGVSPISQYVVKNIGLNFSLSAPSQSGLNIIPVVPTIELTNYAGSTSWVNYTFTVNPTAPWQYLTIGNFRNDTTNNPVSAYPLVSGAASVYAYYFWDDIEVWEPDLLQSVNEVNAGSESIVVYMNPSNGMISVSSRETISHIEITNTQGQKIRRIPVSNGKNEIEISDLSNGIYFLHFYNSGEIVSVKKINKMN